jgi:glycine dehydrogenase subunit 1
MPYTPHTEADIAAMLAAIGAGRIEDLWSAVPAQVQLSRPLNLPPARAEAEVVRAVAKLAESNRPAGSLACFLGGGTYHHYIPPAVDALVGRAEFYTAYTPYQPEVSQGTLQAIFEFQTMVAELTGLEVVNASMYDGAQATAEAVLMAERMRPKNPDGAVLVARSVNPRYREVIGSYLSHSRRSRRELPFAADGRLDPARLKSEIAGALAVVVQHPNYFGCLEDLQAIAAVCKEAGAVLIVAVTEALSLALLTPPGAFGADIVVAEGQSLGIPMGFGGPHLGLFACREADVRRMPGRLIGETVDAEGRRGYVLTLATREQHIRRAKATSNICSNQGMLALSAAIYMTLLGPEGAAELAAINRGRCEYLKQALAAAGLGKPVFASPTFNEFVLDLGGEPRPILERMQAAGVLAGIPLGKDYPELKNAILVTVTEMLAKDELDRYVRELQLAGR